MDANRNYYAELMTLADGIFHWSESASKQNGDVRAIKKCLYEMRSRCVQANNLALQCEGTIIAEIKQKGA